MFIWISQNYAKWGSGKSFLIGKLKGIKDIVSSNYINLL